MAAAKTCTNLAQKLSTIAETWVKDPFRPNLQLQTLLHSLATHPRLTPQAVQATRALRDNDMYKQVLLPRTFKGPILWMLIAFPSIPCLRRYCNRLRHPFIMIGLLKELKRARKALEGPYGRSSLECGRVLHLERACDRWAEVNSACLFNLYSEYLSLNSIVLAYFPKFLADTRPLYHLSLLLQVQIPRILEILCLSPQNPATVG